MSKCLDRRVLVGLAAVGAGVLLLAPRAVGPALPLLLLAACPLSMAIMMRRMDHGERRAPSSGEPVSTPDGVETAERVALGNHQVDRVG